MPTKAAHSETVTCSSFQWSFTREDVRNEREESFVLTHPPVRVFMYLNECHCEDSSKGYDSLQLKMRVSKANEQDSLWGGGGITDCISELEIKLAGEQTRASKGEFEKAFPNTLMHSFLLFLEVLAEGPNVVECWMTICAPKSTAEVKIEHPLLLSELAADVDLKIKLAPDDVDMVVIPAHRAILIPRSDYFKTMFEGHFREGQMRLSPSILLDTETRLSAQCLNGSTTEDSANTLRKPTRTTLILFDFLISTGSPSSKISSFRNFKISSLRNFGTTYIA